MIRILCDFGMPTMPFRRKINLLFLGVGHEEVRVGEEGVVKRHHFAVKEEDAQFSISELRLVPHFSDTCSFFHVLQAHPRIECMPN